METCVLIPQELSLAVTAAGARSSGEQTVSVWSSSRIKQGELYYPFQGTVRIDKLNIYSYVENEDVSMTLNLLSKSHFDHNRFTKDPILPKIRTNFQF